ncbi:replication-relaxation family protein [Amycolatopsis sp. NPDC049868]|uniref:replication-relaxation family protein n=1 Tax=Amycolatopsis sp. NPDC049868 TaxID=3363934 RepID=UPI0037AC0CBF
MQRLDPFKREALVVLYWHRMVSTDQVRRLIAPTAPTRTVQHKLRALKSDGLVDGLDRHHAPRTWHVTESGAELVEESGRVDARPYRIPQAAVVELLQEHTLDVVETGIAFTAAARRRGDECGPLSWTPEVAHRFRDGRGRRQGVVIADAVLDYVLDEDGRRSQRTFFIELDRATMPVARLAQKLRSYVQYYEYVPGKPNSGGRPAWRSRYARFPRLLIVLSGAAEHVLERRLTDLRAYARAMHGLALAGDRVCTLGTTLRRLRDHGPTADIALPLLADNGAPVSAFAWPKTGDS